jgi:NO-binding membrane sensor protein with MHYT domain
LDGQSEYQLAYSSQYTILSFFVPIFVLLGAYSLAGTGSDEVQRIRVGLGGLFAGSSICGMHYLGDAGKHVPTLVTPAVGSKMTARNAGNELRRAGISNYYAKYNTANVVASVFIAVAATSIALTLFFLMRKNFTNSWWKRGILGAVLASGVSAMHWTASVGTDFYWKEGRSVDQAALSRQWIVIIVIALSVFCCVVLLGVALVAGRNRRIQNQRAQRIVLASATFEDGKLMVLPDGTLPMKTITDTFSERSFEETFGKGHEVFHWLYRTSRNWRGVVDLIPGMRRHLRACIVEGDQKHVDDYSVLFREMFCIAAKDLADATHQPLQEVGVLHENMLITGQISSILLTKIDPEAALRRNRGRGKVLFLVKNVEKAEATRLATFGFRFTAPSNVYDVLSRTMQVPKTDISKVVSSMVASDPEREALLTPGVYLGCFAVQTDENGGYDILVREKETSRLPMHTLGIGMLTPAHFRFLQKYHGKTAGELTTTLRPTLKEAAQAAGLPDIFAKQFSDALSYLLLEVKDSFFNQAVLDANPQFLPTATSDEDMSRPGTGTVGHIIVFKTLVPSHIAVTAPSLAFTPLSFFATQQRSYPGCPEHEVHARRIHREFSGRIAPAAGATRSKSKAKKGLRFWLGSSASGSRFGRGMTLGSSSSRSPSMSSEKNLVLNDPFSSAGIMVSQTVTVNVVEPTTATEMKDLGPSVAVTKLDESADNLTWCEALLRDVVSEARGHVHI